MLKWHIVGGTIPDSLFVNSKFNKRTMRQHFLKFLIQIGLHGAGQQLERRRIFFADPHVVQRKREEAAKDAADMLHKEIDEEREMPIWAHFSRLI